MRLLERLCLWLGGWRMLDLASLIGCDCWCLQSVYVGEECGAVGEKEGADV